MKNFLERNTQAFFIGLLILINTSACYFGNNAPLTSHRSLTGRGKISEELVNKLEKYPMLQKNFDNGITVS